MANKTSVLVKPIGDSYEIDSELGYIPAVHYQDGTFQALFVVPRATVFDFHNKMIEWTTLVFVFNNLEQKWIVSDTTKFYKTSDGVPKMLVDSNSMVNEQGQVVTEGGTMTEIDFYIETLGKTSIYPALQEAIKLKLD